MAKPKATRGFSGPISPISPVGDRSPNPQSNSTITPMPTLVVDEHGTELSYIDSGAPNDTKDYVTIFAIHGTVFTSRELRIPSHISSEADAVIAFQPSGIGSSR